MIATAVIILIAVVLLGVYLSRKDNLRVAIFGVVLCVVAVVVALFWVNPQKVRMAKPEYAHFEFVKTVDSESPVESYTLILARGDLSPERERWSFQKLGSISAFSIENRLVETEQGKFDFKQERIFQRNISEIFSLPGFPAKMAIGWDERGMEFITVTPSRGSSQYLRPFSSSYGVFPRASDDFSATRLLISGAIAPQRNSMFGYPRGRAAFLIVQPNCAGKTVRLTGEDLFSELKCTKNPYLFSNNLQSFDDARRHLIRGMLFTRPPRGVLSILASLSPVIGAAMALLALGVFTIWRRRTFAATILAVFVAMLFVTALSRVEFNGLVSTVKYSGEASIYESCALLNSPLWQKSAVLALEQLASSTENAQAAAWAKFILSVRFPLKYASTPAELDSDDDDPHADTAPDSTDFPVEPPDGEPDLFDEDGLFGKISPKLCVKLALCAISRK